MSLEPRIQRDVNCNFVTGFCFVTYRKADVYGGDGLLNIIILGGLCVRSRSETKVALSVRQKIFAILGETFI